MQNSRFWYIGLFPSFLLYRPEGVGGVGWHAPVAARGEGYGTDLWTIGEAGTLELLLEEAAKEGLQPVVDGVVVVDAVEGVEGEEEELLGRETEAQEMIEEEIVQFVRSDEVFCLLLDVAVLVGRDELWGYRSVDDIHECGPRG